ncbi:hypothetical protein OXX79_006442 [Metschnikowia pulcherrima]
MKSFSLGKLKERVGRRFSDPSDFDRASFAADNRRNSASNMVIVVDSEESPIRGPRSIHSERVPRSRSISVSKKQAKELVRHETSQVIQKKLLSLLKDLGLQLPIPIKTSAGALSGSSSKAMKIYVANTHDCVYLAPSSSTSFTYEDVENGGNHIPDSASSADLSADLAESPVSGDSTPISSLLSGDSQTPVPGDMPTAIMNTIAKKMRTSKSANYLCTQIDSQTSIPHLFAVIVELQKDTPAKSVEVEFSSTTKTQWPTTDSANRHQCEESFKIGKLEWDLNFQDAELFINIKNTRDTRLREIDPQNLADKTREYRLFDARKTSSEFNDESSLFASHSRRSSDTLSSASTEAASEIQKAGLYVFLLPLLLPPNIPATVNTANGLLAHKLSVRVPCAHERLNKKSAVKADYNLPMVRTPPSLANSIADKPIYVNRTWNDALHYSITFPRKYVSLGSEHTINVKLVPLAKDVTVKRIKFNILERVTYVSKDLSREYEYDGDDPFARSRNCKTKERIVALCELRTKTKSNYSGLEPFKEEVISCPENNLLYSCYEQRPGSAREYGSEETSVMVASPLDINVALPFLTSRIDKEIMSSSLSTPDMDAKSFSPIRMSRAHSLPKRDSIASLESPSSPIIGTLETHISHLTGGQLLHESMDEDVLKLESSSLQPKKHNGKNDSITKGYTATAKALSPDSNFRHIQISHRLQVSFRISKPDPADNNKMHHYEVVVDTPIVLLSAKCNDGSIQLPEYDESSLERQEVHKPRPNAINFRTPSFDGSGISIKQFDPAGSEQLPSFEEATSAPNSPMIRSSSITSMDPSTPSDPPAYEKVPALNGDDPSHGALTIDDLLVDSSRSSSQRKPSAIHESLQSSFAPCFSSGSRISSHSDVSPTGGSSLSSRSDATSNATSSDDASSQSLHSGALSASSNEDESQELLDQPKDEANLASRAEKFQASIPGPSDSDAQSIMTDDIQFVQRLPLLSNESVNGVDAQISRVNIRSRGPGQNEWAKISTETLDEQAQAQSLFHAY